MGNNYFQYWITHNSSIMFEARLVQGALLKKIIEAIKELVVDANLECNDGGIQMQVCLKYAWPGKHCITNFYHVYRPWILPMSLFVHCR